MAVLGLPSTSQAGQAGSIDLTETTTTDDTLVATTTTVGSIVLTDDSQRALTSTIVNNLDSSAVVLSLQVIDDGYHGSSPSRNIAEFADAVSNDATVTAVTGMTSVQQNAGIANVTVQSNTLMDLTGLGAMVMGNGAGLSSAAAMLVLNPAFTLSNSALAARAIAISALQGGDDGLASPLGTVGPTAIEFTSGQTFELSPENNVASFLSTVGNVAVVDATFGITTVQQNVGISNVQSAFNNIAFTTGDAVPIPFVGQ
jgi:hypothetical protein